MYKILMVDDDENILEATKTLLESRGYSVVAKNDSKDGIIEIIEKDFDLVIVDYDMPGLDGGSFVDICRTANEDVEVIVYSGVANEDEEYNLLNKDIFDFISKSTSPRIFLKKVERALNSEKRHNKYNHILKSEKENLVVDYNNRLVSKDGVEVRLSNLEIMVLSVFLSHMNKTVSREEIHEIVWVSRGNYLDDIRIVDAYVLKLRKKLGLKSIISVRGVGYVWTEK